jgi:hypothetical protein
MTNYSNGEAYGSKALTWSIIAAAALLLVEVTWPQAMPAMPANAATHTATVAAPAERVARVN